MIAICIQIKRLHGLEEPPICCIIFVLLYATEINVNSVSDYCMGLTRVMKDVKSTYVDRAMHCGAISGANTSTL